MDYHFEDEQVLNAVVGTDYLKTRVAHCLHTITSGEKWSLYRAIAGLIAKQQPQHEHHMRTVDSGSDERLCSTAGCGVMTGSVPECVCPFVVMQPQVVVTSWSLSRLGDKRE